MDDKLKQRLVGAIVLVSLAVIFLPMLLDGDGSSGTGESAVPPRPDHEFEPLEIPLQLPEPEENPRIIVDQPGAEEPLVAPSAAEPAGEEPPVAVAPEPEPEPLTAPVSAEAPRTEPPPTLAPAAPAPSVSGGAEAWVVQVGSFSQPDNAGALRERLRGLGFAAFVERAGGVYRVRIGPEAERERAEALMAQLREKTEFDGMVMHYP